MLPYGLTELDVHDVLNVFQCTGLNRADKYFVCARARRSRTTISNSSPIDLLVRLSTCPGGRRRSGRGSGPTAGLGEIAAVQVEGAQEIDPAKPNDHLEFFAEIDLLCALSTCPGGDLSVPLWGPDARDPIDVCRPLGVEVYALDPILLDGWKSPESPA